MTLKEIFGKMTDEEIKSRYEKLGEHNNLEQKIIKKEMISRRLILKNKKRKINKGFLKKILIGIVTGLMVVGLVVFAKIVITFIIGFFMMISSPNKKEKTPEKQVVNIVSAYEKYKDDFDKERKTLEMIKAKIVRKEKKVIKVDKTNKNIEYYYDDAGRVIYQTSEWDIIENNSYHGGKGSSYKTRVYPNEEGYLYGANGSLERKIKIEHGEYYTVPDEQEKYKESFIKTGVSGSIHYLFMYTYDENGKKNKEEELRLTRNLYKNEKEYINSKKSREFIINDYIANAYESKIYVEITKEYDENEKLIRKHVTRKNKHNTIRSETDFDLVKGEIVTKYYDGEKSFATVTETLVGENKAIVKRERDGDEFVIWDEYFQDNKFNKYIVNKRINKLEFAFINAKAEFVWQYNDSETGIDKASFNREHFYNGISNRNDYSAQVSLSGEIYEFVYNNKNELEELYLINYKDNIKLPKELMYKRFANEVVDKNFIENIKKYINKKDILIKENEIENNYKKLLEEINNGN